MGYQILSNLLMSDLERDSKTNPYQMFQTLRHLRARRSNSYTEACNFAIDTLLRRFGLDGKVLSIVGTADLRTGSISFQTCPPAKTHSTLTLAGTDVKHPDPLPPEPKPRTKTDRLVGLFK